MFDIEFLDVPALNCAAGTVRLPGSKSISNRVLLLAALCDTPPKLHDLLDSDDTRVMVAALAAVRDTSQATGGHTSVPKQLFLGNAGTAMRPLTAALALKGRTGGGDFELAGVPRMHERPIGDLVDALRLLGCDITYLGNEGFPPLRIGQPHLKLDAPIQVRGDVSSQFLTALLLALPLVAKQDIHVDVVGELISKPYIDITLKLLARFGVHIEQQGWHRFTIPAGAQYRGAGRLGCHAGQAAAH
jgi:3-phosphoshikimate 1-carboxyvinyltransferase